MQTSFKLFILPFIGLKLSKCVQWVLLMKSICHHVVFLKKRTNIKHKQQQKLKRYRNFDQSFRAFIPCRQNVNDARINFSNGSYIVFRELG